MSYYTIVLYIKTSWSSSCFSVLFFSFHLNPPLSYAYLVCLEWVEIFVSSSFCYDYLYGHVKNFCSFNR